MLEFIKMFGLGILYTILFPVIVVIFAGYLIFALINYIILEVKTIGGFFFGYSFSTDTPLEIELQKIKAQKDEEARNEEVDEDVQP